MEGNNIEKEGQLMPQGAGLKIMQSGHFGKLAEKVIKASADRRSLSGRVNNEKTGLTEGVSSLKDPEMAQAAYVVGVFLRALANEAETAFRRTTLKDEEGDQEVSDMENFITNVMTQEERDEVAEEIHLLQFAIDEKSLSVYQHAMQVHASLTQLSEQLEYLLNRLTKASGYENSLATKPEFITHDEKLNLDLPADDIQELSKEPSTN